VPGREELFLVLLEDPACNINRMLLRFAAYRAFEVPCNLPFGMRKLVGGSRSRRVLSSSSKQMLCLYPSALLARLFVVWNVLRHGTFRPRRPSRRRFQNIQSGLWGLYVLK
jgi:hypothetical protein